jgi:xanthine dehydrogenase YagR molybdenum-binding subunit
MSQQDQRSQQGQGERYVGMPMDRVDGRLKVTGAARYAAEFDIPNLAHAVLVQSWVARGRIRAIDTAAAERSEGVLAVITAQNVPAMPRQTVPPSGQNTLLLDPVIRFSGQNVGVVVAETFEKALEAAALVRIDYEVEPPVAVMEERLDQGFIPNTGNRPPESKRGNYEAARRQPASVVEQVYVTPFEHHNPMEPHATIAFWEGDRLTVYDATQGVSNTAQCLAEMFELVPEKVRVLDPFVGGGFGCKGQCWPHTPLAALAARTVRRPVKLVLTRRQMFFSNGHRPRTRQAMLLAAGPDGQLSALGHHEHNSTSMTEEFMEPTGSPASMMYSCPNVEVLHKLVRLNTGAPTYMRAPGEASGSFGMETSMDELAAALRIDPIELRLRNYAEQDESTSRPWSSKSLKECYARGAERFGWSRRNPAPGSMRDGRWRIGYGMATAAYPANFRPAGAKARMYADGSVEVRCGTQDLGTGTYTILTQIAADTVGVPPSKVRVYIADSALPNAPTSGGSCSATSAGSAVMLACQALRGRLVSYANSDENGPLFNAKPQDVVTREGRMTLRSDPKRSITYAELLQKFGKRVVEQEAFAKPGIERGPTAGGSPQGTEMGDKAKGNAYSMHGFGAQFCEVRVDQDLGIVRVARWVGAFALGKALNAKTLQSQLQGGIVWGIGMALEEESLLDPRFARFVNTTLSEYHVPVNADIPMIETIVVEEQDQLVSPLGAKGAGEIGITGAAAAVCNAVYHATGKRVRELPILLDKLL